MISRSDYTNEMWDKKCELDLAFNALFMKRGFADYILPEVGYCPADLNLDTIFEDNGKIAIGCCLKHYGYDSSFNHGQPGSDLGDYQEEYISDNEKYWPLMCKYLQEKNPELFDKLVEQGCSVYW